MAHRNEPCPCGSGKKYKACCARRRTRSQWLALGSVTLFALVAAWVVAGVLKRAAETDLAAPNGKVWSEEHQHWHDVAPAIAEEGPVGPAPPGKVWSAEHGHWHDVPSPGLPRPAGPAPPGKVWSEEHGHWHDAAGPAAPAEAVEEFPLDDPAALDSLTSEADVSDSDAP